MHSKYRHREAPLFPYLFHCCFGKPEVSRGGALNSCTCAPPITAEEIKIYRYQHYASSITAFNLLNWLWPFQLHLHVLFRLSFNLNAVCFGGGFLGILTEKHAISLTPVTAEIIKLHK